MLEGKIINLRLVEENDASYIVKLRNDIELKKFISPTNSNIEEQKKWIKFYKIKECGEEEFYFIVEDKKMHRCGTVRVYNIDKKEKSCTWGSFILELTRPNKASYDVIDTSLKFIKNNLNLKKVFLEVNKKNKKAIHIYEKVGFNKIGENEKENLYYKVLQGEK